MYTSAFGLLVGLTSEISELNEDGRCYSFDSRGSGYGRGEASAILIVKTLNDAIVTVTPQEE